MPCMPQATQDILSWHAFTPGSQITSGAVLPTELSDVVSCKIRPNQIVIVMSASAIPFAKVLSETEEMVKYFSADTSEYPWVYFLAARVARCVMGTLDEYTD